MGLLIGVLLLSNCARNAYDFNYDDEKILYGVGNSKAGSNFSNIGIPSFLDNPAAKDPSSFEISPSSGGQPQQAQQPSAPNAAYINPYANPYGSNPYGNRAQVNSHRDAAQGDAMQGGVTQGGAMQGGAMQYKSNTPEAVNRPQPAANKNAPYSGYGQSKNQLFLQPSNQMQNQNQNSGYNRNVNNSPNTHNLRRREQVEKYSGLTKTNKTNVIDTNMFSKTDRDRFDLLEEDSFSANNNFEQYRPMYKNKGSKQTQAFVDSLQGSLLEEMIKNDPVSNGFGLDNIPSY